MKNIEKLIIEHQNPITANIWDNMIKEDSKNSKTKIYDQDIFKNSKCFKIVLDDNEEDDNEENEDRKLEEKRKKEYEDFLGRIDKLFSDIENYTNEIRINMEEDQKKREENERLEKLRVEREKKRREEMERKRKEEYEKRKKLEEERKKKEEEELQRQRNNSLNDIRRNGKTIKERLINAGNNFDKIKNEVKKIGENVNLRKETNNILKSINDINVKISVIEDIKKATETFQQLLNELKEINNKDLYIYACFQILATLSEKLYNMSIGSQSYEKYFIVASIISKIKSKTLTYMLYQRISNICPYIIPKIYNERDFNDKNYLKKRQGFRLDDKDIKDVNNRLNNYEYLYFTFLWIDINNNIEIIKDYINNIENYRAIDINYLIGNSFLNFIDVFGNYIYRNHNNWMERIKNIKNKVKEGIDIANRNTRNSGEKSLNNVISYKIDSFFNLITRNSNTKFLDNMEKIRSGINQ